MSLKWLGVVVVFFAFILVTHYSLNKVEAQSCSGSWACKLWQTNCQTPSGGSCDIHNPPSCTCQEFCPNTLTNIPGFCGGLSQAQCGNISSGNLACCSATDVSDGCFWSAPACGPSNCFDGPCEDGSGCTCWGSCSGSTCRHTSVKSCPAPTPTPNPACTYTPGQFCQGTFCTGCGAGYDLYADSSGCCTVPNNFTGHPTACQAACSPTPTTGGPTPTIVGGPTSPPPTSGPTSPPTCSAPNYICSGMLGNSCCGPSDGCNITTGGCEAGGGDDGCPVGVPGGACSGNACVAQCVFFSSCSTNLDCTCGNGVCDAGENSTNCAADCTYDISGRVFQDFGSGNSANDGNGVQNCSGSCNNGSGDERNYLGATVSRSGGGTPTTTNSSGNYSFTNIPPGTYSISLTVPSGFTASTTNPRSVTLGPDATNINFGIGQAAPVCTPGSVSINPPGGTVNPGSSVTLSVTSCTDVENPDNGTPPPPFTWNPDTGGNDPPPTTGGQTDTPTSSTIPWTAPSCPPATTVYTPRVTVGGPGGTTNYSTSITVPGTHSIGANVRVVNSASSCRPTDGSAYQSGGAGATVNIVNTSGSYTINQNQVTTTAVPGTSFTCLPSGINYQVSLQPISGYSIIGVNNNGTQTFPGASPVNVNNLNSARNVTFCIAPIDPWFQTTTGDVRFLNLSNPVPSGLFASTDPTYPGIFYSSGSAADFGNSGAQASSQRQWVINNEYSYNSNTRNRNGGMSYDFYKNKALQDGVEIRDISAGPLNWGQIDPDDPSSIDGGGSGVYEAPGDISINSSPPASIFNSSNRSRVVILTPGNVTINSNISVPVGQGLLIVAAKQNITISTGVGAPTTNSTATNLDGIYTAQGSVIIPSVDNGCQTLVPDRRLNVGGALIANSLKPFATSGNSIQNNRSLCVDNLLYPALYVVQRPDFLIQLTDFYKTSYTKWREVNP